MAITVSDLAFGYPGAETLFFDVSFRVETGRHAGLIGDNAVGKSTLLRILSAELQADEGAVAIDGTTRRMPQAIGGRDDPVTVREFLAELSAPRVRAAAHALLAAERANESSPSADSGIQLAAAVAEWADVAGYELEAIWDAATHRVLRQGFADAARRKVTELSGGERKRLALEVLLVSDADVLLLDEPDNFLDIPSKRWLEEQIRQSSKTILVISHDRELLSNAVDRLVTIEGSGAWTHGGSFRSYHEARDARNERLGDALDRWQREERRLFRFMKLLKQRASVNDANAPRADAAETRWRRFVAAGPPPAPPPSRPVTITLRGADSGRRVVRCRDLELLGMTAPFTVDVHFQERVAIIGPNGSGKSHFLRLLAGGPVEHAGSYSLGARVEPGMFVQTNERPEFEQRTTGEAVAGLTRTEEEVMRSLARYGLQGAVHRPYSELSGGQQARLQVLALELEGANLLLLDEPTDNLDLVSAEALQGALDEFTGTVMAVTHDRWFLRTFNRFLIFELDGSVTEALDIEAALTVASSQDAPDLGPGALVPLSRVT